MKQIKTISHRWKYIEQSVNETMRNCWKKGFGLFSFPLAIMPLNFRFTNIASRETITAFFSQEIKFGNFDATYAHVRFYTGLEYL